MNNPNLSPTPESYSEQLINLIDNIIEANQENQSKTSRQHEESVIMDAPMTFDDCPTATRLKITRPKRGEVEQAQELWGEQAGYRVSIFEQGGSIQTDFLVNEEEVIRRQIVQPDSNFGPTNNEGVDDYILRRSSELLGDALSVVALDGATRAAVVRERNIGKEASPDTVSQLIAWVTEAQPADLKN